MWAQPQDSLPPAARHTSHRSLGQQPPDREKNGGKGPIPLSDAPSAAGPSPAAPEQAALGSPWPGKGCVAMGESWQRLVLQRGSGHGALPWEQTAAGGGLAAPAEAPGARVEPRFSVHPRWVPTGCGQGQDPSEMPPGAGLVPVVHPAHHGTVLVGPAQCRVSGTASLVSRARNEAKPPQTTHPGR